MNLRFNAKARPPLWHESRFRPLKFAKSSWIAEAGHSEPPCRRHNVFGTMCSVGNTKIGGLHGTQQHSRACWASTRIRRAWTNSLCHDCPSSALWLAGSEARGQRRSGSPSRPSNAARAAASIGGPSRRIFEEGLSFLFVPSSRRRNPNPPQFQPEE